MLWRVLSFSHLWIALGAFVTTDVQLDVVRGRIPMERGGMWVASWVALSTGLGYTIQAGDQTHPASPHHARRTSPFLGRGQVAMVVVWAGGWLGFNAVYMDELGWEEPGRVGLVLGVGLASLLYAIAPGMGGGFRHGGLAETPPSLPPCGPPPPPITPCWASTLCCGCNVRSSLPA